jgi:SprB repeat
VDQDDAVWVGTEDKGLYIVDKADAMSLVVLLDNGLNCNGNGKDAEVRAKISGGTPPYAYQWSGGLSGDNPKGVGPGNYSVTVIDSKGKARSGAVTVADTRMKLTAKQKKSATGAGKADGSAEVDIAGNVSGISVQWDNGESLVTALKLNAGTHTVTVTNSKGCSASASVLIRENADPLTLNIEEKSGVRCAGGKDAALNVKVGGGKAPYRYEWNDPAVSGAQPAGLGSGEYLLTVTDAAGLKTTATFNVKQPEPLVVSVTVQAPASTGNANGKALGQAKGGAGPYTYRWGSGENGAEAAKLAPGKQKLIVSDANACTSCLWRYK